MADNEYVIRPMGIVRSPFRSLADCPKQGFEGGSDAWLEIDPLYWEALDGLAVGREILLSTAFPFRPRTPLNQPILFRRPAPLPPPAVGFGARDTGSLSVSNPCPGLHHGLPAKLADNRFKDARLAWNIRRNLLDLEKSVVIL